MVYVFEEVTILEPGLDIDLSSCIYFVSQIFVLPFFFFFPKEACFVFCFLSQKEKGEGEEICYTAYLEPHCI